jgi:hypothetical protein
MNGWTPDMVMRLPNSVHRSLVQMLLDDDKPSTPTPDGGFNLTEGFSQ